MKEFLRTYPAFSLCGLNCGLCPHFHTNGTSKCPGCGGKDFYEKRGSCGIVTCSQKHNNVEYCYQCDVYPCERYIDRDLIGDSFISYKNVLHDIDKAKTLGIEAYKIELNEKIEILCFLLENYNDGRRKNFYCIAINLLELSDIKDILTHIKNEIALQDKSHTEKIMQVIKLFELKAQEKNIELKLRKEKSKK